MKNEHRQVERTKGGLGVLIRKLQANQAPSEQKCPSEQVKSKVETTAVSEPGGINFVDASKEECPLEQAEGKVGTTKQVNSKPN